MRLDRFNINIKSFGNVFKPLQKMYAGWIRSTACILCNTRRDVYLMLLKCNNGKLLFLYTWIDNVILIVELFLESDFFKAFMS